MSLNKNISSETTTLVAKITPNMQEGKIIRRKTNVPNVITGWVGQTIEKCYLIHGFPSDYRGRKLEPKGNANYVSS